MTKSKNTIHLSRSDQVFEILSYVLLTVLTLVVLYPLYFVLIASISDPNMVGNGQVIFFPKNIMWNGYQKIFSYKQIWTSYRNTIVYTVLGTLLNVLLTMITAYPLSRKDLRGKKLILFYMMFTMYFGGGLIPTFLVIKSLGLYNNWLIMIFSGLISISNVIICRTFIMNSIPEDLYEAAILDGANHFHYFRRVVLPLSAPVLAVMALYYGVGHWNGYWTAMIYLNDKDLYPLQLVLRGILTLNQIDTDLVSDFDDIVRQQRIAELMKYGLIVVSSAPLIIIYPFLQKHFAKGVMIGSVKG